VKVTDPKLAEAVVKLREAQAECETLDAAVESYDWLHPIGERWISRIEHTVFYEPYLPNDPSLRDVMRPRASALRAVREVIEAVLQKVTQESASGNSLSACEETENSLVSRNAIEAVRSYMKAQSLTQQQFAKQCRTSPRTLRKFMSTGKLAKSNFRDVARAMNVTVEELCQ
jgi:hypothetical protein